MEKTFYMGEAKQVCEDHYMFFPYIRLVGYVDVESACVLGFFIV